LWLVWRHAQLTGDRAWLRGMWWRVEREVAQIAEYRRATLGDPAQANYGLMPPGVADGGLGSVLREYSNVYWTLAGLRAALEMAQWLGRPSTGWQAEFDDYWAAFDKARHRDHQVDGRGNRFVPPVMQGEPPQMPQRAAWAQLQAIFPGRVFAADDPLILGAMRMLDANQQQGLIHGTGWIADGVWTYAGSFYAHAHLWLGNGRKAAATLYAFANHASPLLCWREEQVLVGRRPRYHGEMPHNWASAEFIRLIRHLLVLERGGELHLLEGLPLAWTKPGSETRLTGVPTSFGAVDMRLRFSDDGARAMLDFDPPRREAVERIVVRLENLGADVREIEVNGERVNGRALTLPAGGPVSIVMTFSPKRASVSSNAALMQP
jgi:hypothetical protein